VVSAGKRRKLWDSLIELRSSLCERRLERTVPRPALLPVKTAQFTQFFRLVHHTVKSPSLTENVYLPSDLILVTEARFLPKYQHITCHTKWLHFPRDRFPHCLGLSKYTVWCKSVLIPKTTSCVGWLLRHPVYIAKHSKLPSNNKSHYNRYHVIQRK